MSNERETRDIKPNRRRAIRTALVLAGVVLAIYIGFILTGVLGAG